MATLEEIREELLFDNDHPAMLLGAMAVQFGMIDGAQLHGALVEYRRRLDDGGTARFGEVMIEEGLIARGQLDELLSAQEMKRILIQDYHFGRAAVEHGLISEAQLTQGQESQRQAYKSSREKLRLGDVLVISGAMSAAQRDQILGLQGRIGTTPEMDESMGEGLPEAELVSAAALSGDEFIADFDIRVAKDHLSAKLYGAARLDGEGAVERIHMALEEKGIVYGVREEAAIADYLRAVAAGEVDPGEAWVIAEGLAPVTGHDGEIDYLFDTEPLKVGAVDEDGIIDYKDRGEIPQVPEGSLIARKGEPKESAEGVDIFGHPIDAPMPREIPIDAGDGVELSEDGRQALAAVGGTPNLSRGGELSVFPIYRVEGDVGYKSGHVDFNGDIQVTGAVDNEFKVKGGRLRAGEIRAAEIEIKGDVVVLGGIIGARIKCGGSLKARYIHKAHIEACGDIQIEREVVDSVVHTAGKLIAPGATLLNSQLSSCGPMVIKEAGSEAGAPCTIGIGTCGQVVAELDHLEGDIGEQQAELAAVQERIEAGHRENEGLNARIGELAQVQDRSQVRKRELAAEIESAGAADKGALEAEMAELDQKAQEAEVELGNAFERQDAIQDEEPKLEERIGEINAAIDKLQQRQTQLKEKLEGEGEPAELRVLGTLYPGTTLVGRHTTSKLRDPIKRGIVSEQRRESRSKGVVWLMGVDGLK